MTVHRIRAHTVRRRAACLSLLPFLCIHILLLLQGAVLASSINNGSMILRIRMGDGSMERLEVPEGAEDTMTLEQALSSLLKKSDDKASTIRLGSTNIQDAAQTLSSLGIKHGSLVTIVPPRSEKVSSVSHTRLEVQKDSIRYNPFPDLAKDYNAALRKAKTRRSGQGGMSFGDIAKMQSSLHIVEPQPEGPIKRVYMCHISAARFQSNCLVKSKNKGVQPQIQNRVALLLGTVNRERVDTKPVKVRTSLSTTPSDRDYCDVTKVHALWEPPMQTPEGNKRGYDGKELALWNKSPSVKRVMNLASLLGLKPIGWIFTYVEPRLEKDDTLPVWGPDVKMGGNLQIANMQCLDDRSEGAKFVTLAMDANAGATEAFQLSDVSVQMVAEGLLRDEEGRFVTTKHAIVVDGKETTQLDSVLCLVNTAMLSHEGSFAGSASRNPTKKNYALTAKTKKRLLTALEKSDESSSLLGILSDFNILVGIDQLLAPNDTAELCQLVRKWARGQRSGTFVNSRLKLLLQSVLGG